MAAKKALFIVIPVLILAGIIIPLISISLTRETGEALSPEQKWAEMQSRTQEAYEGIATELPYRTPTFSVAYDPTLQMFDVEVRVSSWEEYAKIRREATFFRERGLDPCKLYIAWVAPEELMQTPPPLGLDYGCGHEGVS